MTTLAWWTQARQAGKWEPVQKPKPVLDCNKGMRGEQNGPAAYILLSYVPLSIGI